MIEVDRNSSMNLNNSKTNYFTFIWNFEPFLLKGKYEFIN